MSLQLGDNKAGPCPLRQGRSPPPWVLTNGPRQGTESRDETHFSPLWAMRLETRHQAGGLALPRAGRWAWGGVWLRGCVAPRGGVAGSS